MADEHEGLRTQALENHVKRYISQLSSLEFALIQLMNALNFIRADEVESIFEGFAECGATRTPATTPFRDALAAKGSRESRVSALRDAAKEVLARPFPEFDITSANAHQMTRLLNRYTQVMDSPEIVEHSLFGSVVSLYEAFVRDFASELLNLRPEILNSDGKATITYSELLEVESLDDAKRHFVEKKIDGVLRESTLDTLRALGSLFSVTLTSDSELVKRYAEIVERRHLLQHTGGRVNKQYRRKCIEAGWSAEELAPEGSQIGIGQKIFRKALDTFYEMGVKLSQVLWRQVLSTSDDRKAADSLLVMEQYNALVEERWDRALMLGNFALSEKCSKCLSSDLFRKMFVVNQAQALKWRGDSDKCLEALGALDWSGASLQFRIPVAVLKEDWQGAVRLMKENGRSGEIKQEHFLEWPVFREFRKRVEFATAFKEVFGVSLDDAQQKEIKQRAEEVDRDRKAS